MSDIGSTNPRIMLVRHGRTASRTAGWYRAPDVERWLEEYRDAELAADDAPPDALRISAAGAGVVVASDLPRARASAERLGATGAVRLTHLLRETPLPIPALGGVRLPFMGWGIVIGANDALRSMRGIPPSADVVRQASAAARWLASLTKEHGVVVAVTHVNVRVHIAAALASLAWRRVPGGGRWAPWSSWTFTR